MSESNVYPVGTVVTERIESSAGKATAIVKEVIHFQKDVWYRIEYIENGATKQTTLPAFRLIAVEESQLKLF